MNMREPKRNRSGLPGWFGNMSANAVGGIVAVIVVAAASAAVRLFKPLNDWMFGQVELLGWALVLVVIATALLTYFATRTCYRQRPAFRTIGVPRFAPTNMEIAIVRLLRLVDGNWFASSDIPQAIGATSNQDVEQALGRLLAVGWLSQRAQDVFERQNSLMGRPVPVFFRLGAPAISYAQEHQFPTHQTASRE
jgi:hypothetical protein